jgi:hypothetical protein
MFKSVMTSEFGSNIVDNTGGMVARRIYSQAPELWQLQLTANIEILYRNIKEPYLGRSIREEYLDTFTNSIKAGPYQNVYAHATTSVAGRIYSENPELWQLGIVDTLRSLYRGDGYE